MSKVLITEIEEKEYRFALDRNEIIRAEKLGLKLREIENAPITQLSILWSVGLHKHQPNLNEKQTLSLLDKYIEEDGDFNEIIEFLTGEYSAFFQTTQADTKKKKARVEII